MTFDRDRLLAAIESALRAQDYSDEVARDVAFHMTDWLDEMQDYAAFCEQPEHSSSEAIESLLISFLVHVPAHVTAAHRLLMEAPVTDVFGIGAVGEAPNGEA